MQYSENYEMKKPETSDFYNIEDFNENTDVVDSKLKELETARDNINQAIVELKKSVSDGKKAIASAITDMGVATEADAAFENMVKNINDLEITMRCVNNHVFASLNGHNENAYIMQDATINPPALSWSGAKLTAQAVVSKEGYVEEGASVSNSTSITTKAATTVTPSKTSQTVIPSGSRMYFSGNLTVDNLGGDAAASNVLTGKTFSSNTAGREVSGTMNKLADYRYIPDMNLQIRTKTSYTDGTGAEQSIASTKFLSIYEGCTGYLPSASNEHMILLSRLGNATASQVVEGATFTSGGCSSVATTGTLKINNASHKWSWGNQIYIPQYIRNVAVTYNGHSFKSFTQTAASGTPSVSQGTGYLDLTLASGYGCYVIQDGISLEAGTYQIAMRVIEYTGSGSYYLFLSTTSNATSPSASAHMVYSGTNSGDGSFHNRTSTYTVNSTTTIYPVVFCTSAQKFSICSVSIWKLS